MKNLTLQSLPNYYEDMKEDIRINESLLVSLVEKSVNQLILLNKKIELTSQNETIASALHFQKQILTQLKEAAAKGYAYAGLGVMQAIVITGNGLNRLFDYLPQYADRRGYDKIVQFVQLPHLISAMQYYNTLHKADDVSGFASMLPNLKNLRFSPELFDALNKVSDRSHLSFEQELFQSIIAEALLKPHNPIEQRFQIRAQNILQSAAYKGYPYALLVYANILKKQGKTDEAKKLFDQLKFNKFASDSLKKEGQRLSAHSSITINLTRHSYSL